MEASVGSTLGDLSSVRLTASHERGKESTHQYVASGEHIFGIRVKKIQFHFFEPRLVDKARLAKHSCWMLVSDNRGASDEDSEIIEACLEYEDAEEEEDSGIELDFLNDEEMEGNGTVEERVGRMQL